MLRRARRSVDGYHYFARPTEELSAAGLEICIGNSVARTAARVVLDALCAPREVSRRALQTRLVRAVALSAGRRGCGARA